MEVSIIRPPTALNIQQTGHLDQILPGKSWAEAQKLVLWMHHAISGSVEILTLQMFAVVAAASLVTFLLLLSQQIS